MVGRKLRKYPRDVAEMILYEMQKQRDLSRKVAIDSFENGGCVLAFSWNVSFQGAEYWDRMRRKFELNS